MFKLIPLYKLTDILTMKKLFVLFLLTLLPVLTYSQEYLWFYQTKAPGTDTVVPVPDNPPLVSISFPSDGQDFDSSVVATVIVTASDDNQVDSVGFYKDNVWFAVDTTSPYNASLPTLDTGTFELKVIAYDDSLQFTVDSINYVINSVYVPPVVTVPHEVVADLLTYSFFADSAIDHPGTDYTDLFVDGSGNRDIPWSGQVSSLEFTTQSDVHALPNAYKATDRVGNDYIRINNALDVLWNNNAGDGNYSGPITDFSVVYVNDYFTDYEQITGGPLMLRNRNTQDAIEVGGNNGGNFPDDCGLLPENKLLVIEVQQDINGDSKLWINGQEHCNGAIAMSNASYTGFYRIGTPSHIGSHLMYFQGTKLGTLTAQERADMYEALYEIYDTNFVPWPHFTNTALTFDNQENTWQMTIGDTVLINNSPIIKVEYKWALQVPNADRPTNSNSNQLDQAKFIPGTNTPVLDRDDYLTTEYFLTHRTTNNTITANEPSDKRLIIWYRITDAAGRVSDWQEGPKKRDNVTPAPQPTNQSPTVSITNVNPGTNVAVDEVLQVSSIASDPDGTIDSVVAFIDNVRLGVETTPIGGGAEVCGAFPGGRIALVHDGSRGDMDDHGALALSIAMIYWAGLLDNLVFIGHSNEYLSAVETKDMSGWDLPYVGVNELSDWSEMQDTAAIGTLVRAGSNTTEHPVYDWTEDYNNAGQDIYAADATVALTAAMNASSAASPLWVSCAGPMDVIYRALENTDLNKHQYIHLVSHSSAWNEKSKVDGLSYDWQDLKDAFDNVEYHDIKDQNSSNGYFDFRVEQNPATNWDWMLLSENPNTASVLSDFVHKVNNDVHMNNRDKGEIDWSDAGQAYYIISGANPTGIAHGGVSSVGCQTCGTVELEELFLNQCGATDYTFTLPTGTQGTFELKLVAYDNEQATGQTTLNYTVGTGTVTANITYPVEGQEVDSASTHTVVATGTAVQIDSVVFYKDDTRFAVEQNPPYEAQLPTLDTGNFELKIIVWDAQQNSGKDSLTYRVNSVYVPPAPPRYKLLHVTETEGFDHNTRNQSLQMFEDLGAVHDWTVVSDNSGSEFSSTANLLQYDIVIFSNTSGWNWLSAAERAAFEGYIAAGGNYLGIHAASDTYRHSTANGSKKGAWDFYPEMMGGSVQNSPNHTVNNYNGTMDTIGNHASCSHVPDPWNKSEEYYYWENGYLAPDIVEVLRVRSTGNNSYDAPRPMSWYRFLDGGGVAFYTALGHFAFNFDTATTFSDHVRDAALWILTNPNQPEPETDKILYDLIPYFDYIWSADSVTVDTTVWTANNYDGSATRVIHDYCGNFDLPRSGGNKTLAYRMNEDPEALPNGYIGTDRFGNNFMRLFNANDNSWGGNVPSGDRAPVRDGGVITQYNIMYPNDAYTGFENFTGGPLKIRDRNTGNTIEVGGGPGADFPNGSGTIPTNSVKIFELVQDPSGNVRMWINKQPYANGAVAVGVNRDSRSYLNYGTGSHIATHIMYAQLLYYGAHSAQERDEIYDMLIEKYRPDSTAFPNLTNFSVEWDADAGGYYLDYDEILVNNTPIDSIEWKWALHYKTNNTGVSKLNTIKFLPNSNTAMIIRDCYAGDDNWGYIEGGSVNTNMGPVYRNPGLKRVIIPFFRVYDEKGRVSPWIQGPRQDENKTENNPNIDHCPN